MTITTTAIAAWSGIHLTAKWVRQKDATGDPGGQQKSRSFRGRA
jgi:hypothetical protein